MKDCWSSTLMPPLYIYPRKVQKNPTVCKYRNTKKQVIQSMSLFIDE